MISELIKIPIKVIPIELYSPAPIKFLFIRYSIKISKKLVNTFNNMT